MRGGRLPLFLGKIAPLLQLDDIWIAVADMTSGVREVRAHRRMCIWEMCLPRGVEPANSNGRYWAG